MSDRDRKIDELIAKQEILDCVNRLARGCDRLDADLIRSAFHVDAVDDHGVFTGGPEEFITWVTAYLLERHPLHHHHLGNHTCDLDLDNNVAHTETYYLFIGANAKGTPHSIHSGRYIDRLERRDGEWRIALRKNIGEVNAGLAPFDVPPAGKRIEPGVHARDRSDTSYERPLTLRADYVSAHQR